MSIVASIEKEGMLSISREDFAAIAGEIVGQGKSFSLLWWGPLRKAAKMIAPLLG